jgi:hypothetical protein
VHLQAKAVKVTEFSLELQLPVTSINTAMYTTCPTDGFPPIYGRNSTFHFNNISYQQIVDWLKLLGPNVFVQPLAHGYYPPPIAQEIVGVLKDVIGNILGCTNIKITAPIAWSVLTALDHGLCTYLVRNISTDDVAKLVQQHCWATNQIGFIVYTAEAIVPSYLGTIQGLNMTDDDTSDLHGLVSQTFCDSEVASIIAETVMATGAEIDLDPIERAREIISTLRVAIICICSQGGRSSLIANLYITPFSDFAPSQTGQPPWQLSISDQPASWPVNLLYPSLIDWPDCIVPIMNWLASPVLNINLIVDWLAGCVL